MRTGRVRRFRVGMGGLIVAGAAAAIGCSGTSASPDGARDVAGQDAPNGSCGGTFDITGSSPEGPFTATGVDVEVSMRSSTCLQGVQFIIADAATGSQFLLDLRVDTVDGGAPVPLGKTSGIVNFAGKPNTGTGRFQATTTATVDVTAADPPPFATCAQAGGSPIALHTGNIAVTITMSLDGFAIDGTLSTLYCFCAACTDMI